MQDRKRDTDVQNRLLDWEKARVGCSERTALKQVYYQGWNRSPAQVGYMRQVLRAGALGRPRGMGWRGRREGVSGWGTHVNPWLIHVNVWQKPLQYCNYPPTNKNKWKKKSMVDKLWSQAVYAELKLTGWLKEIGKLTIVIWDMTIFYSETDKWRR